MNRVASTDVIHLILKSGGETWYFRYDDKNLNRLFAVLRLMVLDEELSFGEREASAVIGKVRETMVR